MTHVTPEGASTTVHVRMRKHLLERLDGHVRRLNAANPSAKATRSTVLQHLVGTLPDPPAPAKGGKRSTKAGRRRTT